MRQSKLNFNRENRNNGIGYADRNKHFNDPESHSFIKQKKKKTSETLQPAHRKTLRLSSRSAPAPWYISAIAISVNEDIFA